jgi:hypothetical protein
LSRAAAARRLSAGEPGAAARALEALVVGAAALLLALQANVTGPQPAGLPACPGATQQPGAADSHRAWDAWAVEDLSVGGEDVVGKAVLPQYLVLGAQHAAILRASRIQRSPVSCVQRASCLWRRSWRRRRCRSWTAPPLCWPVRYAAFRAVALLCLTCARTGRRR